MEYFNIEELGLPADSWRAFALHRPPVSYRPGQLIYLQGTEAAQFYYLAGGIVKTFISSEDGNEKVLTLYREGFLFGEASFFDQMPRVSSAMAVTACRIVPIDRELVTREIAKDPNLALHLLKYVARTVRLLSRHVDDMAFLPADRRIARHLLSLQPDGEGLLRCTHEDIAATVSASRVTVSRVLGRFAAQGWLETKYRGLRLLRPDAIQDWLSRQS